MGLESARVRPQARYGTPLSVINIAEWTRFGRSPLDGGPTGVGDRDAKLYN